MSLGQQFPDPPTLSISSAMVQNGLEKDGKITTGFLILQHGKNLILFSIPGSRTYEQKCGLFKAGARKTSYVFKHPLQRQE